MDSPVPERGRPALLILFAIVFASLLIPLFAAGPAHAAPCLTCGPGGDPPPPDPHTLTVTITGSGIVKDGTVQICAAADSPCDVIYADGDSASLTATGTNGQTLTNWGGACSGSSTCSLAMNDDRSVTASFADHTPPAAPTIGFPGTLTPTIRSDSSPAATFSDSDSSVASLRCAVDGATATACSSPWSLPALANGSHTLHVKALDAAGNLSEATRTFSYINVPDTTLTGTPADGAIVNTLTTAFSYFGGSTQMCTLDDFPYPSCLSDWSADLADGQHVLKAAAGATLGDGITYLDKTPAARTWTIDTHPPDTSIQSGPPVATTARTASFAFSGDDPAPGTALSYECKLDGAAFAPCTSGQSYSSLAPGSHTFSVRAKDAAGNLDATPATSTWTVIADADAPQASSPPSGGGAGGGAGNTAARITRAKLSSRFGHRGKLTLVRKLRLTSLPSGSSVTMKCKGHGCPFKSRTYRPRHGSLDLSKALRHRKLSKGARLEIDVITPGAPKQVFRFTMRSGKKPRLKASRA